MKITLDSIKHAAIINRQAIPLSAKEFQLLAFFLAHSGEIVTREQLNKALWPDLKNKFSNVVDVYIVYLRKLIGADRIQTVRGEGFIFNE